MARPGLTKHRKFLRLARAVGNAPLALGCLELIWSQCYESGEDYLGDALDVEAAAQWPGAPGALVAALLASGGDGNAGFIEEVDDRPGHFRCHDLYDHAPDYVQRRRKRELERREKGVTLSQVRSEVGRKGAESRHRLQVRDPDIEARVAEVPQSIQSEKRRQLVAAAAKAKATHTAQEWEEMLDFFGHSCVRCGASGPGAQITKDHIIPMSARGSDGIHNLQPLCSTCNIGKGAGEMVDYRMAWSLANDRQLPDHWLANDATPAPAPAPAPNPEDDAYASSCAEPDKPAPAPPPSPVVLTLPCVGKGPKEWPITEAMMAEWAQAFPGVDPLGEARRMKLWLEQNPKRGKTHTGMGRFTLSWLGRAQDQSRTPSTGAPNGRPSAHHHRSATDAAYIQQLDQRDAQRPAAAAPDPDPDLQRMFG